LFGVPVLCADIPVFHEITSGLANFFDPNRPDALARLVKNVIEHPGAYAGKAEALQRFCLETYDPSATTRRMADLLGIAHAPAIVPKPERAPVALGVVAL